MAYFAARDEQPSDYCREKVRDCDVYVGLIGLRYGSPVRDRPEVSYTELEFDTATEAGLPRLVFLMDENAALPIPAARLHDREHDLQIRQRAFRSRLLDARCTVRTFSSPEELELELLQALQESQPASRAMAERAAAAGRAGRLPAPPDLVGRDAEVSALVQAWLATPPEPVAVLGAPGIGKSAICLAALHDQQARERFGGRRWFVRCDGARSADALWSGLAAELGVIGEGTPGRLADDVCATLGTGLAVVVLDNFETPWTADPLEVEELLRALGAIPQVGLAVSARGTARPAGLHWRDFSMLSPLPLPDARRMFLAVAGTGFAADPHLDALLAGLDGVPLAVELMGYAAQGQPALDGVTERWRQERTGMLQRMGGGRRELSVAVSVETSITTRLMTGHGRRLLSLLGVLPDGTARPDLATLLPDGGLAAADVLRQLGLAFDEGDRLRTLAPVREHTAASHPPQPADLDRAVSHYAQLAAIIGKQVGGSQGSQAAVRLQAETGNIAAMLQKAAALDRIDQLTAAVCGLARYWQLTGLTQTKLLDVAEKAIQAHGTARQQADTWLALGGLAMARSDHDTARARYEQALPLYQQVGAILGQANCIKGLGDIALERSDHDTARARYQQALPLYQQVGDILGEANCIQSLGDIALRRSDHDTARARYQQALPLYQQVGAILGQANCIQSLGNIALERSDHDTARARYQQALPLYQQVGAILGQANCIKGLGNIALERSDHDTARARYQQALPLYQQVGDILGQANCIQSLGDIALERSDHDTARARYQQALPLYQAIPEPYSIGWAHVRLARLDSSGQDRAGHWNAAREAWASIGRDDLIESIKDEFQ